MKKPVKCTKCGSNYHYQSFCPSNRKSINQKGKEHQRWVKFREDVAKPYLDNKFGYFCRCCKRSDVHLDIDHIHSRGSRPELKYQLSNLQYLCRSCHINKTSDIYCIH